MRMETEMGMGMGMKRLIVFKFKLKLKPKFMEHIKKHGINHCDGETRGIPIYYYLVSLLTMCPDHLSFCPFMLSSCKDVAVSILVLVLVVNALSSLTGVGSVYNGAGLPVLVGA